MFPWRASCVKLATSSAISLENSAGVFVTAFVLIPSLRNLASLLGSYFPQYVAGVKANRAAGVRGPGAVDSSALVVHSGGHMGAFSGEAWLPQALPSGVSVPHMFIVTFVIMLPISLKTNDPIKGWEAGLVWVFFQSFILMIEIGRAHV